MKNLSLGLLIVTCLLLAAPAFAQNMTTQANIPFEFTIGKHVFPAGQYTAEYHTNRQIITLRDENKRVSSFVVTAGTASGQSQPKWVFADNGNTHYLLQVGFGGNEIAELPTSQHIAAKQSAYQQVEVATETK